MDEQRFFEQVAERLRMEGPEPAREITRVVLLGLHIQLPEEAARRVEQELPQGLRELWAHRHEELKAQRGSKTDFARHQFIEWVADHTELPDANAAERAIRAVFAVLREEVPVADEVVREELSEGILELWAGHETTTAAGSRGR